MQITVKSINGDRFDRTDRHVVPTAIAFFNRFQVLLNRILRQHTFLYRWPDNENQAVRFLKLRVDGSDPFKAFRGRMRVGGEFYLTDL